MLKVKDAPFAVASNKYAVEGHAATCPSVCVVATKNYLAGLIEYALTVL